MPGIYCDGGVYEADVFDKPISDGEDLKVSAEGRLTGGVAAGDQVTEEVSQRLAPIVRFMQRSPTIEQPLHLVRSAISTSIL